MSSPNYPEQPCSHCGTLNSQTAKMCQNCGMVLPNAAHWPPPPGGMPGEWPEPEPAMLFTGNESLDRVYGAFISILLFPFTVFFGLGLGVIIFLYVRHKLYKCYKQGLLIGIGIWAMAVAGAFIWCLGLMTKAETH